MSTAEELLAVPPVTVLGIGNIILRDEGLGVRAVERLRAEWTFPEEVQLLDGGTLGPELLHFVTGTEKLLVLDAVSGGQPPGTVYRFENDAVMTHFQEKLSAHEIGIQDLLAWLTVTERPIPSVVLLGIEPYEIAAGLTLSAPMAAALPALCARAAEELCRWGVSVQRYGEAL